MRGYGGNVAAQAVEQPKKSFSMLIQDVLWLQLCMLSSYITMLFISEFSTSDYSQWNKTTMIQKMYKVLLKLLNDILHTKQKNNLVYYECGMKTKLGTFIYLFTARNPGSC